MTDESKLDPVSRMAIQSFRRSTWKAIQGYRLTGEMVPTVKNGKVVFLTVDAALKSRWDYKEQMAKDRVERRRNLVAGLASAGQTPADYGL